MAYVWTYFLFFGMYENSKLTGFTKQQKVTGANTTNNKEILFLLLFQIK